MARVCTIDRPKRRWRVYSLYTAGNPLLVDSFDLRQDAQRLVDRLESAQIGRAHTPGMIRAQYVLRDGQEEDA